jgi:hypothetical protein
LGVPHPHRILPGQCPPGFTLFLSSHLLLREPCYGLTRMVL